MTSQPDNRDAAAWAQPIDRLQVSEAAPGARIRLELKAIDLLECSVSAVYRETLHESAAVVEDDTADPG